MTTNNLNRNIISAEAETMTFTDIVEKFLDGFRKLWWIAVVVTLISAVVGYLQYKRNYVPVYESRATFSITAAEYNEENDESYTNNSELAAALSVSFDYIINNEIFYEIIENDIGINYMPSTIYISAVEDTNILSIVSSGNDPQLNYKVIESVVNNYASVAEFVLGDTDITILEEPSVPYIPTNPYRPIYGIMLYALVGFFFGLIPSVFYTFFIKTIKSTDDIGKYLSVPCLGALPAVFFNRKSNNQGSCSILNKKVGFRYVEAMRSVASKCERTLKKNQCKVILITSTKEGEGKSTFAMNLAYSLSKGQKKVMLIDGDLRRPTLRKITGAKMKDYSLEQFLDRKIKSNEAIVNLKKTRVLLFAPNIPSNNPMKSLNSAEMAKFIEETKKVVDYVIIDSPECGDTSDAAVLAKYCDGVMYVVKEDETRVNKILYTIQKFSYTRTPIIGCVLNGTVNRIKNSYGYGYGRHYGYGTYGYGRYGYGRKYGYGYGYGRYGYGAYGYGSYGYGEYGEVSEEEFSEKEQKVSKRISMTTTEEQKKKIEMERQEEIQKELERKKAEEEALRQVAEAKNKKGKNKEKKGEEQDEKNN